MNGLKKIGAIIMCVCLLLPLFSVTGMAAAGSLSISSASGVVGSTVAIKCSVNCDSEPIGAAKVVLTYDAAALEFVSGSEGTNGGGGSVICVDSGNGTVTSLDFSITFKILKEGSHTVIAHCSEVYDWDLNSIGLSDSSAIIKGTILSPTDIVIAEGDTLTGYVGWSQYLTIEYLPENANSEDITFTSSDTNIVEIDAHNLLIYRSVGTATVKAVSESGLVDEIEITVKEPEQLTLGKEVDCSIKRGHDIAYEFTPERSGWYMFSSTKDVGDLYASLCLDREELTYVDNNHGLNFMIKHYLDAGQTYRLFVGANNEEICSNAILVERLADSMEIVGGDQKIGFVGENLHFYVGYKPNNARFESETWSSSDMTIAEINGSSVKLLKTGTVTITATSENGLTDTVDIIVKEPEAVELNKEYTDMIPANQNMLYTFTPAEDGAYAISVDGDVSCYVTDSAGKCITHLDRSECWLVVGETYNIRLSSYSYDSRYTFSIIKSVLATEIQINQGDTLIGYEGATTQTLSVNFTAEDEYDRFVTWSSSNEDVVRIQYPGNDWCWIDFVEVGTAIVTATYGDGTTDTIEITVISPKTFNLNTKYSEIISSEESSVVYEFTPEEDGAYAIFLECEERAYVTVKDSDNKELGSKSGSGGKIELVLQRDETYKIVCRNGTDYFSQRFMFWGEKLIPATEMSISQGDAITAYEREWFYLSADFIPYNSSTEEVVWESSDTSIATVSDSGAVDCLKPGIVKIKATSANGYTDNIEITVLPVKTLELGIKIEETFVPNKCIMYAFTPEEDGIYFFRTDNKFPMIYTGEDPETGDSDSGDACPDFTMECDMKAGTTYYFGLQANSYKAQKCNVWIEKSVPATGMEIAEGDKIIGHRWTGKTLHLNFLPEGGFDEDITWTSSDPAIASVWYSDSSTVCNLRLYSPGTVTITATSKNFSDSIEIEVKDIIDLILDEPVECEGKYREEICCIFTPEESGWYSFSSDVEDGQFAAELHADIDILYLLKTDYNYVDNNFKIDYYLEAGHTYYLYVYIISDEHCKGTVVVEQRSSAEEIEIIQGDTLNGCIGTKGKLSVMYKPDGAAAQSLKWTSSNPSVVKVSGDYPYDDCNLEYVGEGTAIITVTTEEGLTDSIDVVVREHDFITVAAVSPTCTEPGLSEGKCCSACGEVLVSQEVIDATGHDYVNGICSVCDDVMAIESGWALRGGKWYYFKAYEKQTGWQRIDGAWYYFNDAGTMQTGWQYIGGTWYYMNSSGAMQTGWQYIGGTWYYFHSGGAMATGNVIIDGAFNKFTTSGAWLGYASGWQNMNGKWYYTNASGKVSVGWKSVGGTYYYFNASGVMQTGWLKDGSVWYYLNNSGAMVTGWQYIGGTWYYMNSSGAMQTGWQYLGGTWYYFHSGGAMATGTVKIGGTIYKFNASGAWIR